MSPDNSKPNTTKESNEKEIYRSTSSEKIIEEVVSLEYAAQTRNENSMAFNIEFYKPMKP